MKKLSYLLSTLAFIAVLCNSILGCGPAYVSPIFEYEHAPENPFENFAAGKIGIVKASHRRVVLFAAYRYLTGGSFSADEQKALVEVWNADFNNRDFEDKADISEAVKKWVATRKEVVGDKEEKTPEIYVEREYGGYDFFPNCTKNAFQTAARTLSDRMTSFGSDNLDLKDWIKAQDAVFTNCSSGRQIPDEANQTQPLWLQKDRAYQVAAAHFYSLNYEEAKRRFAEIAEDSESPWQETAEYLVGRTLIRQASLAKDLARVNGLYIEAEQHLQNVSVKSSKFGADAERLLGLIKYRLHPQERVGELAQKLSSQSDENFRQDLIDYKWLLAKFEKEILETEDQRKEEEALKKANEMFANVPNAPVNTVPTNTTVPNWPSSNSNSVIEPAQNEGDLRIYLYDEETAKNWTFFVKPEATDEEAIAMAETVVGRPLTDKMKEQVRAGRKSAYSERFSQGRTSEYQGWYSGRGELSLSLLPDFLRQTELTDWLFTFQIENTEAYLYSLTRYRQTSSDLWLLTALSKADKTSTGLNRLLEDAAKVSESSPAFPTIAFHRARLLIEFNKVPEARKVLDEVLNSSLDLPISTRNKYLGLRVKLSETLEDFLRFAQRKPFAFDLDGTSGTIDSIIAEQKTWYSQDNEKQSREEYEREIEENFKEEKLWQDRLMFDYETVELINQHFPTTVLLEAQKSTSLPDYLREQFALAIWTRAVLLQDYPTAARIAPEILKFKPQLEALMTRFLAAKTPAAQQTAALYLVLKNPMLTPYFEDGLPRSDNEFGNFDANDWWCGPYDTVYDEKVGDSVPRKMPARPAFLTQAQSDLAQLERKKLKEVGDAPKFLGDQVLAWAKRAPTDKRVPESLYIVWQANGWTKYGCGSDSEFRQQIGDFLRRKYPNNEWTKKMSAEDWER